MFKREHNPYWSQLPIKVKWSLAFMLSRNPLCVCLALGKRLSKKWKELKHISFMHSSYPWACICIINDNPIPHIHTLTHIHNKQHFLNCNLPPKEKHFSITSILITWKAVKFHSRGFWCYKELCWWSEQCWQVQTESNSNGIVCNRRR